MLCCLFNNIRLYSGTSCFARCAIQLTQTTLISLFICVGVSGASFADDTVGYVPGIFDVTNSGAATYTIPIEVPPGIADVQPKISLNYSSKRNNGPLGKGWNLLASSVISRCPTDLAQDGFIDPVDYDSNDRFCLNGSRLKPIDSTGNIFTIDSVGSKLRIEIIGEIGQLNSFMIVHKPGGIRWAYGSTQDSITIKEINGTRFIHSYHLSEISKTGFTGNEIRYFYHDNGLGTKYINEIHYAKYKIKVELDSQNRPDTLIKYLSGDIKYELYNRISSVRITNDFHETLWLYKFQYKIERNTTLLHSVNKCNRNNTCLSETKFEYDSQFSLNWPSLGNGSGFGNVSARESAWKFTGDFDGNGQTDIGFWNVDDGQIYHGLTKGDSIEWVHASNASIFGDAPNRSSTWRFTGDFNADGKIDIGFWDGVEGNIWIGYSELHKNINNKIAWNIVSDDVADFGNVPEYNHIWRFLGDFNGDGATDIGFWNGIDGNIFVGYSRSADMQWELIANGYGFGNVPARADAWKFTGDFNGDNRIDIGFWNGSDGNIFIHYSGSGPFEWDLTANGVGFGNVPARSDAWKFTGDFNGDNRTDIGFWNGSDGNIFTHYSGSDVLEWDLTANGVGFGNVPARADAWKFTGDFNGDNRTDIGFWNGSDGNIFTHYSGSDVLEWDLTANASGFGPVISSPSHWKFTGDFSGNSKTDIGFWFGINGDIRIMGTDQLPVGYMSSYINGLQNSTTISYSYLTDDNIYTSGDQVSNNPNSLYLIRNSEPAALVVSSYTHSTPQHIYEKVNYSYEGLLQHNQGLGYLGFKKINMHNETTGLTNIKEFSQEWDKRKEGFIIRDTSYLNGEEISRTINHVNSYVSNDIYFPHIKGSSTTTWDIHGNYLKTITNEYYYTNQYDLRSGYMLKRNTSCVSESPGDAVNDSVNLCVNLQSKKIVTTDYDYFTEGYFFQNSYPLVKSHRVTSTINGSPLPFGKPSTEIRSKSFDYHPLTGVLKSEINQPDNPDMRVEKTLQYDNVGQVTSVSISGGNNETSFETKELVNVYETSGLYRLIEQYNEMGHKETYTYNDFYPWLVKSVTTPNGVTTNNIYNMFGEHDTVYYADNTYTKTSKEWCNNNPKCNGVPTAIFFSKVSSTNKSDTYNFFDSLGNIVRSQYLGQYNSTLNKNIISDANYDYLGRVISVSDPYFENEAPNFTVTTYDPMNRPTSVTSPDGSKFEYSYNGLRTTTTHLPADGVGGNKESTNIINALGQDIKSIDNDGNEILFDYDAFDNLVRTTDPEGHLIEVEYDVLGRKIKMKDPDKGLWIYSYYADGNLRSQTDAKNQTSTMIYDKLSRMTDLIEAEGTSNWVYDSCSNGIGKLCSTTNNNDYTQTYHYNTVFNPLMLLSKTITSISGQTDMVEKTTFDTYNRVSTITYPGGFKIRKHYTTLGYLSKITNDIAGDTLWEPTEFNARGQIELLKQGSVSTTRNFDQLTGNLTNQATHQGGAVLSEQNYSWLSNGNLDNKRDTWKGQTSDEIIEYYDYDSLNRMTSYQTIVGSTQQSNITLDYSNIGNIKFKSDVGNYHYDPSRPHAVSNITGIGGFTYDSNGNMVSGDQRTIEYTSFNKPKSISTADANTQIFYSPNRSRYKRIDSGNTSSTIYYAGHYEKEIRNGITLQRVSIGSHTILEKVNGENNTIFTIRDYQGSLIASVRDTGEATRLNYDPWGKRRDFGFASGDMLNIGITNLMGFHTQRGFTNHEHLSNVGLIHMGGRVYSPNLAIFLSPDPYVSSPNNLQDYNRYTYALNNPLVYTDPTGLFETEISLDFSLSDDPFANYQPEIFDPDVIDDSFLNDSPLNDFNEISLYSYNNNYMNSSFGVESYAQSNIYSLESSFNNYDVLYSDISESGLSSLDKLQLGLDAAGLTPALGVLPDLTSSVISLARGDFVGFGLSLAAAVPVFGQVAGGAKIARTTDLTIDATKSGDGLLFGQKGVSRTFTSAEKGSTFEFAGQPIADVAKGLRNGSISPNQLPIDYVVINGQKAVVNNRSLTALRRAGMQATRTKDVTSNARVLNQVQGRLNEMGGAASSTIKVRGIKGANASAIY